MRALLDTNVILDSLLQRPPWHTDADQILTASAAGRIVCAASSHSISTVFYVARRVVGSNQARNVIRLCLQAFEILPVDLHTLTHADSLSGPDFEDNIQIAAAVQSNINAIVTRDPAGFSASPIRVVSPAELLRQLPP